MKCLSVSRVSFGDNSANLQTSKHITANSKLDDSKLSDNAKLMIGLGALSTTILGGLLVHKSIKLNKLSGKVKELEETITKNKTLHEQLSNAKTKLADSEKLIKELDAKINTLPEKIKLHETKEGRYILGEIHNFVNSRNAPDALKKDMHFCIFRYEISFIFNRN